MTHTDWESRRERISVYLDGELAAEERAELEAHLPTCDECQRELVALRQIRGLLRALPRPAPPRAFTLPEASPTAPALRRGPPRWSRPAQALGSMAAVVGLGLLVASALPHLGVQYSAAATSNPGATFGGMTNSGSAMPSTSAGAATTAPGATVATPIPTDAASGATEHTPAYRPQTPNAQPFPVLPVTGGTLLVGGAAALTLGSLARRRGRDAALPEDEPAD